MTPDPNAQLKSIRDSVALVGRLSDSIVRLGPFSLGLDGLLIWLPVVGEIYSVLAGGFILVQGIRARVPVHILVGAGLLLFLRTTISAIPVAGDLVADLFTAHKWAARLIVGAIDRRLAAGRDMIDVSPAPSI